MDPTSTGKGEFDFERMQSAISALRDRQVFFVCGVVKSGTTWLQLMLDAHPDVSCHGEGHFLDRLEPLLSHALSEYNQKVGAKNRGLFGQFPTYPGVDEAQRLFLLKCAISLLLIEQPKADTARSIGEKSPDNIRHLNALIRLFPKAKIIHIVRDGRDCAVSCWFHNLRILEERTREHFRSLDEFAGSFADTWTSEVSAAARFGNAQPDRYLVVRYEDLVANEDVAAKAIFEFLDVEYGSDIVRKCGEAASFQRLSGGRTRGEENRDSFFRNGVPGEWRQALGEAACKQFVSKAGPWLSFFGYEG